MNFVRITPRLRRFAGQIVSLLVLLVSGALICAAPERWAAQTVAPLSQSSPPAYKLLPPGEGRALTIRVCSRCHSPEINATKHLTPQGWYSLVQMMSARGAVASDSEFDEIATYLAKSFPSASVAGTSVPAASIPASAQNRAGAAATFTNSLAETGPLDREGNWPMTGGDPAGMRYSTLNQITPSNVKKLRIAWIYHMKPHGNAGATPDSPGLTFARYHLSEDQPLVVGPTMYVATPYSEIVALDSASGSPVWIFHIPGGDQCSLRGVAYWPGEAGYEPAIILGT